MSRNALIEFEAVLAIVRTGSFRAAAADLAISTTALSTAIAKLERQLGVRLFDRTTRRLTPTEAGQAFVDRIGPAIASINRAMGEARAQQDTPTGTLRINAYATAAREMLSPLILRFTRRYPQVAIDLVTEGRLVDVVAAGFDLGVRRASMVPGDAIAIPLVGPRRFAVVAAPAYLQARGIPLHPQDLLAHTCIRGRLPNGALFRWPFEREGTTLQIDVPGRVTLDEARLARIAVLAGSGIGYFMEGDVRGDIAAGTLVRVLEDWSPQQEAICLYYPNRRHPSAAFQAFVAMARNLHAAPTTAVAGPAA